MNPVKQKERGVPDAMLEVDASLFAPGERICVAVSGGADSTALLRILQEKRAELGIVLRILHVEHGLRGDAGARDAEFVVALAKESGLECDVVAVDTPRRAAAERESTEEAARNLRYEAFGQILRDGRADKVATAHTLNDQAETVLMKLLRGAWTEGLSGIHPVLRMSDTGACIRPLLKATREQVEAYLRSLGQGWCEDATNQSRDYTRNRVRHELMPMMRAYNPQIDGALAHIAENARAEEQHWQAELARTLPQLLLPGRPVRGGGRSVGTHPQSAAVAVEILRLEALDAGLRRRVLRAAAEQCGATLDFKATERLVELAVGARAGAAKRLDLPGGVRVERTLREIQFGREPQKISKSANPEGVTYVLPIPGTVDAPAFRAKFTAEGAGGSACVRTWRPGDRVELAHSRGPKKVKEILERLGIRGDDRALWPVVEWQGQIVWMRGVVVAGSAGKETALRIAELAWPFPRGTDDRLALVDSAAPEAEE